VADLQQLNRRFGIESVLTFQPGTGGLACAVVRSPVASGRVYLHGAHVTDFQPASQKPLLFLSEKSHFTPGKPIRGGIPICFPWFGARAGHPDSPGHGFARLTEWEVESTERAGDGVRISLALRASPATREVWNYDFVARYVVTFGATLTVELRVQNLSQKPLRYEEALHTYLSVGDVRRVKVTGLESTKYVSKVEGGEFPPTGEPITISAETDRIYLGTTSTVNVVDDAFGRTLTVGKTGSNTTVVWNPWVAKSRTMTDFGDDEWPGMICVETCNNTEAYAVAVKPGETHSTTATIGVG